MGIKQPKVAGVFKITKANIDEVKESILGPHFLDAAAAEGFIDAHQSTQYERVDHQNAPHLSDDKKTRHYMWQDPEDPGNPEKMIVIYGKIFKEGDITVIEPDSILKGPKANFVMFYQMSCCGGLSSLVSLSAGGTQQAYIRDSLMGTQGGHSLLFKDKVRVANTPEILDAIGHLYQHIAGQEHDCDHHADYNHLPPSP